MKLYSTKYRVASIRISRLKPKAFSHDRVANTTHEWLTPPEIIKALGTFDLDPCAAPDSLRPWDTAREHFDKKANGLLKAWHGRIWLNPPYENNIVASFLKRMAQHGNGVVLIFARVETKNWFSYVWSRADAVLFIRGRLRFCRLDGKPAAGCGGAPSALIAYGRQNVVALERSNIKGQMIYLK